MQLLILIVLFGLAFAVLILPRQRELRRHQALMGDLAVGDEVMMGSGVYGTIRDIDGEFVRLEVAPGTELKIAKRAVAARVTEPEESDVVDLTIGDEPRRAADEPDNGSAGPDAGEV
jgi:preprotein translocase subunit YajC